jgi:hypothetical protein
MRSLGDSKLAKQKPAGVHAASLAEEKLETFAEDLGRMLGTARAKADSWLGQREQIVKALEVVRETAGGLLRQLGQATALAAKRGRRASLKRGPGRPKGSRRTRRPLSAEARERIAAAQRARWARVKAAKKR